MRSASRMNRVENPRVQKHTRDIRRVPSSVLSDLTFIPEGSPGLRPNCLSDENQARRCPQERKD